MLNITDNKTLKFLIKYIYIYIYYPNRLIRKNLYTDTTLSITFQFNKREYLH